MIEVVKIFRLTVAAWVFLFLSDSVYAYLDPGSGSMVLQLLLGGVAALGVVIKLFWHRILNIFGVRKEDVKEQEGVDSNSTSGSSKS